ncbi:mitochondrial escape protein 2 [Dimargaris xerosporica]|nr:mitochondrial escape protein 2 [Dimargaris xerosporica]
MLRHYTSLSQAVYVRLPSDYRWLRCFTSSRSVKTAEATVYFDNVYPLKLGRFDLRGLFFRQSETELKHGVERNLLPQDVLREYAVASVRPRFKEGGLLVQLQPKSTPSSSAEHTGLATWGQEALEQRLQTYLSTQTARQWFNGQTMRCFRVQGRPFTEDLINWYPSSRLRVEFIGPDVPVETLYRVFRPFGRIFDITIHPPAVSNTPRYAVVQFTRIRPATTARNCLHDVQLHDTQLRITYERIMRQKYIWNWLTSHPRLVLPFLAGAIVGIIYAIFDPIRIFFIESKILQRFSMDTYPALRRLGQQTLHRIFSEWESDDRPHTMWAERQDARDRLEKWLNEVPETFIVVQGPRGTGKAEIVRQVTRDRPYKLVIDVNQLAQARTAHDLLVGLAKQVGYRPVFGFMEKVTNFMDLAVTATTGQKAGLTDNTDSQISKVLDCLAIAIYDVHKKLSHREAELRSLRAQNDQSSSEPGATLSPTAHADTHVSASAHSENPEEPHPPVQHSTGMRPEFAFHPSETPLIIITGFMNKDESQVQQLFNEKLPQWAAMLVENQAAHVVFVSCNVATSKVLSRALPHKPINCLALADASPQGALTMLRHQLNLTAAPQPTVDPHDANTPDPALADYHRQVKALQHAVDCLGGRLTDLELLLQKVKGGQPIDEAVKDIVQKTVSEVRKFALSTDDQDASNRSSVKGGWDATQFWAVLVALTESDTVNYHALRSLPVFNGDDKPLQAMEYAELILVSNEDGRPTYVRPARPVFKTVFREIRQDPVYAATMQYRTNQALIQQQTQRITQAEEELQRLQGMAALHGIPSPRPTALPSEANRSHGSWLGWPRVLSPWWWWSKGHGLLVRPTKPPSTSPSSAMPMQLWGRAGWLLARLEKAQQTIESLEQENQQLVQTINAAV